MKFKEKIRTNSFIPTFPWGFVNPFYINRKLLAQAIKRHSALITGRVLDYGCGSKPYRSFFTCDEYIGVDIENPGHPHQGEDVDVFFDGKNLPFEKESFDACISSEVIEHVFDIDTMILEIKRVLKPKGKVLLTTPFVWDEHEAPHDYCRYTSFGLKNVLERNGFRIINYEKLGTFQELIIQLYLIRLNREWASGRIFKYFLFLLACPSLNLLSLIPCLSAKNTEEKTIYLGHKILAEKI